MPRSRRITRVNGWYHVMNRGVARRCIFLTDWHRMLFLDLLGEVSDRFEIEVHSFCLMQNHFHLLIRTPHDNLSESMQFLCSRYVYFFNKDRTRDGALFRGRFKSILILNDRYLANVSRYIHLNPVESGDVACPSEYEWSSYQDYVMGTSRYGWLYRDILLAMIPRYEHYVSGGNSRKILEVYSKDRLVSVLK